MRCRPKRRIRFQSRTPGPPRSPFSILVVGAGPTGLACAIEAQKAGFRVVLVDKGCICNSLFHYPAHMTFFTTPELLEIGDIPFPSPNPKPTRNEALQYYRLVAAYYKLDVRQYQRVERVEGATARSRCICRPVRPAALKARKLAISTGYYDLPNLMEHSRRESEQGSPLLRRSAPVFRAGCGGGRAARIRRRLRRWSCGGTGRG